MLERPPPPPPKMSPKMSSKMPPKASKALRRRPATAAHAGLRINARVAVLVVGGALLASDRIS
jgi:hypothetical protein